MAFSFKKTIRNSATFLGSFFVLKNLLKNQAIVRVGYAEDAHYNRALVVAESVRYFVINFLEMVLLIFWESKMK